MGVSCKPSTYVEGAGLLDDVDALIKKAQFVMFDYNKTSDPAPTYKLDLEVDGEVHEQYWSVGDSKHYFPSSDGKELNGTKALNPNSNAALLFASMVNAGVPEELVDIPTETMEGAVLHFNRVAAPERPGIKRKEGDTKKCSVLIVTAVVSLPGEKAAAAQQQKSDISGKVTEAILGFIAEAKGNRVQKATMPTLIFSRYVSDPDRNEMLTLAFDDDFLRSGPWSYVDGILSPVKK